jgi:hypothetical protein
VTVADRWRPARAGGLLAGAALLAAACAGTHAAPSGPTGPAARPPAAATAAAAPREGAAALATGRARRLVAARYLAIAQPANRRLDHDFDDGIDGPDRDNLAAADADLRDAASTERSFDRQLVLVPLAPDTEAMARILVAVNQSRARLTSEAAASTSLAQLHAYAARLTAANVPVEDAVRVIRSELGLPPPESRE